MGSEDAVLNCQSKDITTLKYLESNYTVLVSLLIYMCIFIKREM
jgi:hypothetical protein